VSDEARYFRVGVFVFGGVGLAVVAALLFGGGALFARKPVLVETIFDESVQGVDVGSAVKLRGVQLGTVKEIAFVSAFYDVSHSPDPLEEGGRVLVRMEIRPRGEEQLDHAEQVSRFMELVEKGLRFKLTPLGLTGTSFIEADFLDPAKYPPMQLSFQPHALYVPSAPSTITQLSSAAERLMSRIDKLDVERLLNNLDTLLVSANEAIGGADVPGARKSVGEVLADVQETSAALRRSIASADLGATTEEARRALVELTATLARLQGAADASGDDIAVTLENLRAASQNLREAAETARAYPSFLFFGDAPRPVEVEER
jgi:ABC-type transporter Mla subunit MlaD